MDGLQDETRLEEQGASAQVRGGEGVSMGGGATPRSTMTSPRRVRTTRWRSRSATYARCRTPLADTRGSRKSIDLRSIRPHSRSLSTPLADVDSSRRSRRISIGCCPFSACRTFRRSTIVYLSWVGVRPTRICVRAPIHKDRRSRGCGMPHGEEFLNDVPPARATPAPHALEVRTRR